ncbi:MAG: NUDIX domain-containing protein [Ignavibacteria bacterium]
MQKQSAGILLYRFTDGSMEIFLVHPGGPLWSKKDAGSWSIPKGEFTNEEDALTAAKREFFEETGTEISGDFHELKPVKQKSGKIVHAWTIKGNIDPDKIKSNNFEMEWPLRSGKMQSFPEIDRGCWFGVSEAKEKINQSQKALIDQLLNIITENL